MAKTIIGVMGPGDGASAKDLLFSRQLGEHIAAEGWVLLTGGRNTGVMDAASKGAQQAGGLTIGILPSASRAGSSQYLDIPICTGMGGARNNINVLSSDVVVVCGSGAGTTSEVMLALKAEKPIVLLNIDKHLLHYIGTLPYPMPEITTSPAEAIERIHTLF